MTTAVIERRLRVLEEEVEILKKAAKKQPSYSVAKNNAAQIVKKLPTGLRQALREVKEGKVVGPFNTTEELIADLES